MVGTSVDLGVLAVVSKLFEYKAVSPLVLWSLSELYKTIDYQ
jgi:hypothetical protein